MDLINTSFLHNKEVVMVIRLVVAAILGGMVLNQRLPADEDSGPLLQDGAPDGSGH